MAHSTGPELLDTTRTSLRLLNAIKERNGATSGELADALGLARSTVHVHLKTLRNEGFVTREGNQYHVGLKLLDLGEHAKHRGDLFNIAKECVRELANESRFEADFLVNQNGQMVLLYGEIGSSTDPNFRMGKHFYMHTTGTGKAILAEWPRERVERVVERWGLPAQTENSITSETELFEELQRVRDRGYGINEGECLPGYRTIGAAVRGPFGNIIGGLGVGGPEYRIEDATLTNEMPRLLADVVADFESKINDSTVPYAGETPHRDRGGDR